MLVHPAGFEPAAFRSGGERSIRLSYGCALQSNSLARSLWLYLRGAVGCIYCLIDYLACLRVNARAGIMGGNPRNETQGKEN